MSDNREMYAPPEARPIPSKWCDSCNAFGDHHTDRHEPDEELADSQAVREALLEARKQLRKAQT